jgi:outer membrane translocation and assembly module TamA
MTTDIFAVNNIYLDNEYDLLAGVGIGAGYMTVAGPIRAGVSYGKNPFNDFFGNINGYLSIGFNF